MRLIGSRSVTWQGAEGVINLSVQKLQSILSAMVYNIIIKGMPVHREQG